ncbi:tRNA-dihydrouridine synthase [Nocardia sp. NPDC057272]|uniref:oxidoreductase n=1 Tax=Nocardia sp. NPDC057272 TaxID=3346079 RepID=UPI003624D0E5
MPTPFAALFEPLKIGSRMARNRIVHAPMSVCYGDEHGYVTEAAIEHYARRAQGGAGLVVTENFAINAAGRQMPRQTMVSEDVYLPGLTRLAMEVKARGALVMAQIVHAGRYAGPWEIYDDARRLAPSAVPFELTPGRWVTPAEITEAEIWESIRAFGDAAELCRRAGFDGVDIHAGQGFLISSFLSPRMNRRSDAWGGSFDNRVLFALEVVREVRRRTGPEFIVAVHLQSDELMPTGWTIDDAVLLAPRLVAAGVDMLFPTSATFESLRHPENAGLFSRRGYGLADAAAVKQVVDVPVIANGGLGDPADAITALEERRADAIGLARALFVDPDWPEKVSAEAIDQIRRCPCQPSHCLRTQLQGAVCDHWPPDVVERGYLGIDD